MLRILEELPAGLTDRTADQLSDALGGPCLIHIEGEQPRSVFISVLLHGNETTGWEAMRRLLARFQGRPPLRGVDLFIGNVHAARRHRRRLQGQPDFNRVWMGASGPEGEMASRVLEQLHLRRPLLGVDVHNTSGRNPCYALCHRRSAAHVALARSFSDTVVYVDRPAAMLGVTLAASMPATTLECGRPGVVATEERVTRYLADFLNAPLPVTDGAPDTPLLRCIATVRVPEDCSFSFSDEDADLQFMQELDRHNFATVPAGTPLARIARSGRGMLEVLDEQGRDVSARFFRVDGDCLVTREAMMPSLLTMDERIIRQDCLCYLLEPVPAAPVSPAQLPATPVPPCPADATS